MEEVRNVKRNNFQQKHEQASMILSNLTINVTINFIRFHKFEQKQLFWHVIYFRKMFHKFSISTMWVFFLACNEIHEHKFPGKYLGKFPEYMFFFFPADSMFETSAGLTDCFSEKDTWRWKLAQRKHIKKVNNIKQLQNVARNQLKTTYWHIEFQYQIVRVGPVHQENYGANRGSRMRPLDRLWLLPRTSISYI